MMFGLNINFQSHLGHEQATWGVEVASGVTYGVKTACTNCMVMLFGVNVKTGCYKSSIKFGQQLPHSWNGEADYILVTSLV